MNSKEVYEAYFEGGVIQHEKGGVYELEQKLQCKKDGVWAPCLLYRDVDTRVPYVRFDDDFGKFKRLSMNKLPRKSVPFHLLDVIEKTCVQGGV